MRTEIPSLNNMMEKSHLFASRAAILSAVLPSVFCCAGDVLPEPISPILPGTPSGEDEGQPAGVHKNVLLIMADDFNYWARCVGYCDYSITPNIDGLAGKGVLFTNAYCSSPVSNPSRNALWSGLRPSTTGIDNNPKGYVRDREGFEHVVTMNQYFMENGYFVLGAGKLYHPGSMGGHETDPDHWSQLITDGTGSQASGARKAEWTNPVWETMTYHIGEKPSTEGNTADLALVNKVAALIEGYAQSDHADQPFFIGCGVFRPHLPWNVSVDYWNRYEGVDITVPGGYVGGDPYSMHSKAHEAVVAAGKWSDSIRAYMSCMTMSDRHVGILLDALERTPYKDNTIILFMGDHGWHFGEKDNWGKNTVYNPANRTTLVIYDPSTAGQVHVCDAPVSLQDIYPTLVRMCSLPKNTNVEGNDLSPLLEDPGRGDWNYPVLATYSGTDYILDRNYKYIDSSSPMLFDMRNDPYETTNLYGRYEETVAKVYREKMDSILMIGKAIRQRLGVPAASAASAVPGVDYPASVLEGCAGRDVIDRKVVMDADLVSNTMTLDLLSSDHVAEVALFDRNGELLEKTILIGEMTTTYSPRVSLRDVVYVTTSDDSTVSAEKINVTK